MSSVQDQNIALMKTILTNASQNAWDVVRGYVSEDIVVNIPIGLPYGGDYRGFDRFVESFKALGAFYSDLKVVSSDVAGHGDKVIIMNHMTANVRRNGKPITLLQVSIWRFEDGKLAQITPYFQDTKMICDIYES